MRDGPSGELASCELQLRARVATKDAMEDGLYGAREARGRTCGLEQVGDCLKAYAHGGRRAMRDRVLGVGAAEHEGGEGVDEAGLVGTAVSEARSEAGWSEAGQLGAR